MKRVGIVGFGNMGEAVAAGLRRDDGRTELAVVEPDSAKRGRAVKTFGAADFTDRPFELPRACDLVVVAVKPQDYQAALEGLSGGRYLSVMAGVSTATLSVMLGSKSVARIMPNLAARWGRALVGLCFAAGAAGDGDFHADITTVAACLGSVVEIPERLMPAVTGVSGSGIAFALQFAHALALGGVKCGLAYPEALSSAIEVLVGAATALRESGLGPAEFVTRVTSPAGTTIAGIQALEEAGFTAAVMSAVEAAATRAAELEN